MSQAGRNCLPALCRCPRSSAPCPASSSQLLRQFEALCRGRSSPKSSHASSVLAEASSPCAADLLTDVPPLPSEGILQPLSAAPLPAAAPASGGEPRLETEPRGQPGPTAAASPREQEAASRLHGDMSAAAAPPRSLSLFAGMELVARPGTVLAPLSPPAEPRTLPQPEDGAGPGQSEAEGGREPSAFSFLNV